LIDRGKAAVAAAEEMAFGGTDLDVPLGRSAVERRVAGLTTGPWWRSCGPAVAMATPRRGTRSSSAQHRTGHVAIHVADEQLTVSTAAHELAHALAGVGHGHDAVFRAAYVDVVAVVAGAVHATALADAFLAMDVAAGGRRWPAPYWAVGEGFVVTTVGSGLHPVSGTAVDTDGDADASVALHSTSVVEHSTTVAVGDRRGTDE
jgi:hypothetical protein